MTTVDWIMRVGHLVAAIVTLGGIAYAVIVLTPSLRLLDDDLRVKLLGLFRRRFTRLLHSAIGVLLISGAYHWWRNAPVYARLNTGDDKRLFMALQGLLGLKVLAAVGLFAIVLLPEKRSLPHRPDRGMKGALVLGIGIVMIAAAVRCLRLRAMGM